MQHPGVRVTADTRWPRRSAPELERDLPQYCNSAFATAVDQVVDRIKVGFTL